MDEIIIGAGSPNDRNALRLETRSKRHIPNEMRREVHPDRLKASIEMFAKLCPNASIRSITAIYNCIGMIFGIRRTWIDPQHLETILPEDEYYKLSGVRDAEVGDIVLYRQEESTEITHIALIVKKDVKLSPASFDVKVMSKWGWAGEYVHQIDDVPPQFGEPSEFWSERRVI